MGQFDLYPNPSKSTRKTYPYLLDIQSDTISEIATRIVIPLGKLELFKNQNMKRLTPMINYNDEQLLMLTPQMSSVQVKILKTPIGSLNHFRDEIIAAIDFAITGI